MSTHVLIAKKASGHNLQVTVINPGTKPREHVLTDNEHVEVMVYGDGSIHLQEVEKAAAAAAA